jgi:hypothetical protein
MKWKCLLLGHDYRYNFKTLPSRTICACCRRKWELDVKTFRWKEVNKFTFSEEDKRTDEELIKKWIE